MTNVNTVTHNFLNYIIKKNINLLASTPHFGILGLTVDKDIPNLKL